MSKTIENASLTKCASRYAGTCNGRHCGTYAGAGEAIYLKGKLVCRACLQSFADDVVTTKSAKTVIQGCGKAANYTGLPTGLLYWVIRQNGITGADRMRGGRLCKV
jgi:hypothetical protein